MIYLLIMLACALLISFSMGALSAIWYTTKAVDEAIWPKTIVGSDGVSRELTRQGGHSRNSNP